MRKLYNRLRGSKPSPPKEVPQQTNPSPKCHQDEHIWITADVFGSDDICIRCWATGGIGSLFHPTDKSELQAMLRAGFVRIPVRPAYYTGRSPIWSKTRESWLPEVWHEVYPWAEAMSILIGKMAPNERYETAREEYAESVKAMKEDRDKELKVAKEEFSKVEDGIKERYEALIEPSKRRLLRKLDSIHVVE